MTEDRLKSIESTWRVIRGGHATPPALVAMEQVKELIAEVRRLNAIISKDPEVLRARLSEKLTNMAQQLKDAGRAQDILDGKP